MFLEAIASLEVSFSVTESLSHLFCFPDYYYHPIFPILHISGISQAQVYLRYILPISQVYLMYISSISHVYFQKNISCSQVWGIHALFRK